MTDGVHAWCLNATLSFCFVLLFLVSVFTLACFSCVFSLSLLSFLSVSPLHFNIVYVTDLSISPALSPIYIFTSIPSPSPSPSSLLPSTLPLRQVTCFSSALRHLQASHSRYATSYHPTVRHTMTHAESVLDQYSIKLNDPSLVLALLHIVYCAPIPLL